MSFHELPFFQIKDIPSVCEIGPRLVHSTRHQILKIKKLMLAYVYTKPPIVCTNDETDVYLIRNRLIFQRS